jgi:microcystin degradation protein MlrC
MKLMIASLVTETNSFSPIPTGRLAFEAGLLTREGSRAEPRMHNVSLHVWRRMAEERDWDIVESLTAAAQPAGITSRASYEEFRDEILSDLKAALPDIFLINMHGAMIAEGYDDCEGDMMTRARAILGPDRVIGLELDPHNHLTDAMLANATLIVNYKEYPHIDPADRAVELFIMAADAATGKTRPVMRAHDCKMLTIIRTLTEPGKSFVQAMKDIEGKDGILSVSLTHGFPWGDVVDVGAKMLVIANDDAEKAAQVAQEFAEKLWDIRDGLRLDYPDISNALDRAEKAQAFPVTLADMGDNPGGGAPSDATFFLAEILRRGLKQVGLALFWDPVLVAMCQDAGIGARMQVRLGGKVCEASGKALDLDVTVRGIRENMAQAVNDMSISLGTGVWLDADGVHIILSSKRAQCYSPSVFTDLGLNLTDLQIMIPKSTNHFYQNFARVSAEVIHVGSPGAVTPDIANIPFTKRDGKFWPKAENPFA